MAQNFINGILIPEDGEPRRVALETDGRGLMGDALSRLVGGCFDTLPIVIPGVDLWVNDDGTSEFGPNRAIYATRAMEERGYLSQIDYRHVPAEGELYTILHGQIVALGFDPNSGASVSLTEEQAETVTEYFTETSPAGSGLLENLRLRLGLPSFADPTDTSDPTGIATSSDVVTPSMKGL